jgi:thiamine-phosphate pyrophosphorylase
MKLAIVSPLGVVPGEQEAVVAMLENGLAHYHLRKPGMTTEQLYTWLEGLPAEYHQRVSVHGPLTIALALEVGGVHLRESDRAGLLDHELDDIIERAEMEGLRLSASVHSVDAALSVSHHFSYVFLSQAFDSNSKPYPGRIDDWAIPAERPTSIYALGGVTAERVPQVAAKGLDGVAVLSAVWQGESDPLSNFLKLRAACENAVPAS